MYNYITAGVHNLKQKSVQLLKHQNKYWHGRNMAMVLFIVTPKSIYSALNGCYVNSPTSIFISIFLLHMRGVVHSSTLAYVLLITVIRAS